MSQKFTGETARLLILRDGKEMEVEVTVRVPLQLVPWHIGGAAPSYLIVGGLVLTRLIEPFLEVRRVPASLL